MNHWIQKIRRGFFKLTIREQLLLIAIFGVLILWWLSAEMGEWRGYWTRYNSQNLRLQEQGIWLDDRSRIEAELSQALNKLDSTKTYSSSELTGRVDDLARATGLTYSISNQRTSASEDFNTHAIRISVNKSELRPIIEFCNKLQQEAPYLVIDSMNISANRARPREHTATFIISSFELKNIAL